MTNDEVMSNDEIISLMDEDGNEVDFVLVDIFEIDEKKYALLEPVEDPEEGAVIFIIEKDDKGEEVLRPIEDDAEFEMVRAAIEEIYDEED